MQGEPLTRVLEHHFLLSALQDVLLHGVLAHEPVDADMRFLADTVGTCHRLQVVLGVPVALSKRGGRKGASATCLRRGGHSTRAKADACGHNTHVEDDDRIGRLEVDT